MLDIDVKIVFKRYSFEQDTTDCKNCHPARWLVMANYECIYFPRCEMYGYPFATPLKIVVASYKNLKDAKKALYKGRIRKREVVFDTKDT